MVVMKKARVSFGRVGSCSRRKSAAAGEHAQADKAAEPPLRPSGQSAQRTPFLRMEWEDLLHTDRPIAIQGKSSAHTAERASLAWSSPYRLLPN